MPSRGGPVQPNHWSQCWIELQLGVAYAAANKIAAGHKRADEVVAGRRARSTIRSPASASWSWASLAFEQGKYDPAIAYVHEATISAACSTGTT